MSKARDLADLISAGNPLADGAISVSEISDLTATATELNYVDGVTSAVQTQIDTKAPTASPTFTGAVTSSGNININKDDPQLQLQDTGGGGTIWRIANGPDGNGKLTFNDNDTERLSIQNDGKVAIGAPNFAVFNGVGGNSQLLVKGSDTNTSITDNTNASITIANDDGTANNLAGFHFARADTDDNPHYAGASVVAQFVEAQVTGQYPKAQLSFLTSTASNTAPSEKFRISPEGALGIGGAAYGTSGQVLTSGGSSASPSWTTISAGAPFSGFGS
jgi:hypothetical protein